MSNLIWKEHWTDYARLNLVPDEFASKASYSDPNGLHID